MRNAVLGMIAGLGLAGAVWAQEVLTPNPQIEGTIRSQIDAFLQDDFVTAFTYASPGIRGMFGTPENFGAMVRNGYPMVWRPSDVQFGALRERDGAPWQQVLIEDAEGRRFVLEYRMEQVDGAWRISGVEVVPAPDVAA
ncbi:DUF4864 domain-containing protein [Maliponia aquimaris]|uniref:DUF4864 domain-containing protein n=1 Tax=Maliponia aquimaris TaxID=1673631 RepID=A0A238K672_9RHOB|nr:DUF4864 domain-containing protein [Maliponia aquimaris]SMX38293.1 hypothetical protein MAA8898_01471 [Maliponia aquimaris]